MPNITQVADEIVRTIDDPELVTIGKVAFWLRTNLGSLNTLINTDFAINETSLEVEPELDIAAAAIIREMYEIYYWNKIVQNNSGASAYSIVEVAEGDSRIRRTARTEFAKVAMQNKKDHKEYLDKMTDLYRRNRAIVRNVDYIADWPLPWPSY